MREEKRILNHSNGDLTEQKRNMIDKMREFEFQISKLSSENQSQNEHLRGTQIRLDEAKVENNGNKLEREKLYHKIDLLNEENSNLRNEVYMLKKLLLEYDKREIHLVNNGMTGSVQESTPVRQNNMRRGQVTNDTDSQYQSGTNERGTLRQEPMFDNYIGDSKREYKSPPRLAGRQTNILTWNQPYDGSES